MSITFPCDCGKSFTVADQYAGKRTRCPACETAIVVPHGELSAEDLALRILSEAPPPKPEPIRATLVEEPPEERPTLAMVADDTPGNPLAAAAARAADHAAKLKREDDEAAAKRGRPDSLAEGAKALAIETAKEVLVRAIIG